MGDIMANHLTIKIRTTQWDYLNKKYLQDHIVRYFTQHNPLQPSKYTRGSVTGNPN